MKRSKGRPPKTDDKQVPLSIYLPPALYEKLLAAAAADRRSLSNMAVQLLEEGLKHHGRNKTFGKS